MAAFGEAWATYLARGVHMKETQPGPRLLFLDYDSTLNPGQGNAPISTARADLLRATFAAWRREHPELQLYVLTASNPEVKSACLATAGLRESFDAVLSSSMPKRYESKGEFLKAFLAKAGVAAEDALHADDSHDAIESIMAGPEGPVCHTLRLPYRGAGLMPEDLELITDAFVRVKDRPNGEWFHAYSFAYNDAANVDLKDSTVKCMLDGMDEATRKEMIEQNAGQPHLEAWLDGRPDYVACLS